MVKLLKKLIIILSALFIFITATGLDSEEPKNYLWQFTAEDIINSYQEYKDRIFVNDGTNQYVLDAKTGKELYRLKAGGVYFFRNKIFMINMNENAMRSLFELDVKTGKRKLIKRIGRYYQAIFYINEKIFMLDINSNILAVNTNTGKKLWEFKGGNKYNDPSINKTGFYKNLLIIAFNDTGKYKYRNRQIAALNLNNGKLIWSFKTVFQPTYQRLGNKVYTLKKDVLYTLDASTGRMIQKEPKGIGYSMDPGNNLDSVNKLIFSTGTYSGRFFIYDTVKKKMTLIRRDLIGIGANKQFIYATNSKGPEYFFAFSQRNMKLTWKKKLYWPDIVTDKYLISTTLTDTYKSVLTVADATTGKQIKEFSYEFPMTGDPQDPSYDPLEEDINPPALYKDTIFVSSLKKLYAVSARK